PSTPPTAQSVSHTFSSPGGTVTADCSGAVVTLRYWSPAQGYEADHVVPGPGETASIRFRQGGRGHGIRLAFSCSDGSPVQSTNTSDDDCSSGPRCVPKGDANRTTPTGLTPVDVG